MRSLLAVKNIPEQDTCPVSVKATHDHCPIMQIAFLGQRFVGAPHGFGNLREHFQCDAIGIINTGCLLSRCD
jgi:hypothetical protein